MHHHRLLARAVFRDILQAKAGGKVEVELHGRKLLRRGSSCTQYSGASELFPKMTSLGSTDLRIQQNSPYLKGSKSKARSQTCRIQNPSAHRARTQRSRQFLSLSARACRKCVRRLG